MKVRKAVPGAAEHARGTLAGGRGWDAAGGGLGRRKRRMGAAGEPERPHPGPASRAESDVFDSHKPVEVKELGVTGRFLPETP